MVSSIEAVGRARAAILAAVARHPDVHERLARGDSFHLVDVREESEWQKGHLPGAMHLGKGVIERDAESKLPPRHRGAVRSGR